MRNGWSEVALDSDACFDPHCEYMAVVVCEGPRPIVGEETLRTEKGGVGVGHGMNMLLMDEDDMGVLRRWGESEDIMTSLALSAESAKLVPSLISRGHITTRKAIPANWQKLAAAESYALRQTCLAEMAAREALPPRVGGRERLPSNEVTIQLRPTSVRNNEIWFQSTNFHLLYNRQNEPSIENPRSLESPGDHKWGQRFPDNTPRFETRELCLTSDRKAWISTDHGPREYDWHHPLILVSKLLSRPLCAHT
jgi:hypothetical protein